MFSFMYALLLFSATIAEDLFHAYESCLRQHLRMLQLNRGKPIPKAVLSQQGSEVKLDCSICYRPDVDLLDIAVTWYRVRPELGESEVVPIGEFNFRLTHDKSLVIDSVGEQHSAHYLCVLRGILQAAFYLEVVRSEKKSLVVTQGKGQRPAKDKDLPENNLHIYTSWSEWTKCSSCDKIGFRRRTGICTVKKQNIEEQSKPVDVKALNIFITGLPCRAITLKKLSLSIPKLRNRKSEVHVDYCYKACPTKPSVRNVTDKFGNLIERVEKEGVISIHEERPALPPLVHRETHYLSPGGTINFTCPKAKLRPGNNVRVRWENGTKVIHAMYIRRASRGRVYIDSANRLHFKKVRPSDSAYYSCWQSGWLVASFRIVCERKDLLNSNAPQVIFYIGVMVAISVIFCIGYQMWKSNRDKRMR